MILILLATLVGGDEVILPFVLGGSCERNMCDETATFCSKTLPGVYRYLGPSCASNSSCTACSLSDEGAIVCSCETKPFTRGASYGQPCSPASECTDGSICFRPCNTFLYLDYCPSERCQWDYLGAVCEDLVAKTDLPKWSVLAPYGQLNPSESQRGTLIVRFTPASVFPANLARLKAATLDYMFGGTELLSNVLPIEDLFFMLDLDGDGAVSVTEFSALPDIFASLNFSVPSSRKLNSVDACVDQSWCPILQTCVDSCTRSCEYLNTSFLGTCTIASVSSCVGQFYCSASTSCVTDCSSCDQLVFGDTLTGICRSDWWSLDSAVCRSKRKSTGQSCLADFDCVDGAKRCVANVCAPVESTCVTDRDCDPLTQFCAKDLSAGADPYFVSTCVDLDSGRCESDIECSGLARCNFGLCTPLFSLPVNAASSSELLCESASLDPREGRCGKKQTSLRLGQACVRDTDCGTSTPGLFASCVARNWWESGSCRICGPTLADFSNNAESLKSWLFQKGVHCGNQWTDAECVAEKGALVNAVYKTYMCEKQTLFGGIVRPSSNICLDEGIVDYCN